MPSVFEITHSRHTDVMHPWKVPFQSLSKTILIDSRDRNYTVHPNANDYRVELPYTIRNVTSARLISAELPKSFYAFSSALGNTSVVVSVDGTSHTITIPDGNYTPSTLAAALKTGLDAAFTPLTFTATVSPTTQKLSLECSNALAVVAVDTTGATPTLHSEWGLGYYMGFAKGVVRQGTGSVTGPLVVCTTTQRYVVLDIEELNQVGECGVNGNGETRYCFAKIPCNTGFFENAYFDKLLTDNIINPPLQKVDRLHIRFRYHTGEPVDFNGLEHSLTLEFMCTTARQE